jgi:HIRAN domain-containing protein
MKAVYVAWQDPKNRTWYPVGRLNFQRNEYRFVYTKGALKSKRFIPFGRMTDKSVMYTSRELFPLFANRILSKSRPEYKRFLQWLAVDGHDDDPIALLARTGGIRETDTLMVFPAPVPTRSGQYHAKFFVQGLRYLPEEALRAVEGLARRTQLFIMPDPQNLHDSTAVALRTDEPRVMVGYCPRYLGPDFLHVLRATDPRKVRVLVEQVNPDAPIQLRLLCSLKAPWPQDFEPCAGDLYEPLASDQSRKSGSKRRRRSSRFLDTSVSKSA